MVKIIPLTKEYLMQAAALVSSVFPSEDMAPRALVASIDEDAFGEFDSENSQVKSLEYFIAVGENDKVLGISGLYSLQEDHADSYWLGWYCVDPEHQGKGIGKTLLKYCVGEAKRRGKKYLKVRTSTNPAETKAQEIYEKNGFELFEDDGSYVTQQKKEKDAGYDKIFRRKILN